MHRMELNRVIQSFLQSNPYCVFIDPNPDEGYEVVRVRILKQPPAEVGVSAGMRVLAVLTIAFLFYAAGILRLADLGWKVDLDLPPDAVE